MSDYTGATPPLPPPPASQGWGQPGGAPARVAYAHWGLRVAAYLVDALILAPAYVLALIVLAAAGDTPGTGIGILVVVIYLAAFAFAIWNLIIRQGKTGWSIGKKVVGIRLVLERTGEPLGPLLTFGRQIAHILDGLPCDLGYLWPLWDAKKQTFADKVVGSVVVVSKES